MRVSTQRVGIAAVAAIALVVIALASLALMSSREAAANHTLNLGLDFNTTGTPASGVYNPASLPTFQNCAAVLVGNQVSIDIFVLDVERLVAFESDLSYDGTKVKVVKSFTGTTTSNPNGTLFMSSQALSDVQNVSQNDPNPTTGVLAVQDTDGLYEAAASDTGNTAGDNGYGVLARVTFQGVAAGISTVNIPSLDLNGDTTIDTGAFLSADNPSVPGTTVALNDTSPPPNGDGFYDGPFTNKTGTIAVGQDSDADGIADYNCSPTPADNCPTIYNPSQADLDGDGKGNECDGDADGEGYWNQQEGSWGSDQLNAVKTPDVCDGADNDGDTTVDEGSDFSRPGGGAPNGIADCSEAVDTDGDTIGNNTDTDDDGDGATDTAETWIRTDTLKKCSTTTGMNGHYAWMPDVDNSRLVNIADALKFIPHFLTSAGNTNFNKRFDWSGNNQVNIQDVLMIIPYFLDSCTP